MPPASPEPWPERSGLQPERTGLAWQRTSITATVTLVALVLVAVRLQDAVLVVLFSAAAVGGSMLVLGARCRLRELRDDATVTTAPYDAMARVAAATCIAAVCGAMTGLRLFLG